MTHTVQTCTVFSGWNLMIILQKKISYVIKNNSKTRKAISLIKSKHTQEANYCIIQSAYCTNTKN